MSYRFADSLRTGSGQNCSSVLILLASFMTYTIAVCAVKKVLMMNRGTRKYVEFYSKNKFGN
jgi:hypothetical protein